MKLKGVRKLVFGSAGLVTLLLGLGAVALWPQLAAVYPALATADVSIVVAVCVGNVGEHLAGRKEVAP